ncbi:MAG: hypothetical protein ACLSVD_16395 [Eggerthellaceae bacterium]
MNVVETRGLAKAYRGRRVVDRFDMRVAQGDIYGFVGERCGKSTVMKMICGLVAPTGRDRAVRLGSWAASERRPGKARPSRAVRSDAAGTLQARRASARSSRRRACCRI